jgi:O-antigen/teichoic acid export membrane protein
MNQQQGEPLKKSEIRLEYTGFIIFAAQLLSVATGFFFQLMITRATDQAEYGVWSNVSKDVLSYFTLMAGVLPFWALRFTARGKEGAVKTGVIANLTISLIAASLYVLLVPFIVSMLNVEKHIFLYFITAVQIVETYAIYAFEQCLQAKTPHVIGYGLLLREVSKVFLGYLLINNIYSHDPLFGAMLSLILAFIIQSIYYLKLLLSDLKQKFEWNYLKEWIKGSVVNIYNAVGNQLASFVFIMLFIYGGDVARGDYGAASIIAAIINYSSFLAFALYPKLLAEGKIEDVTTSMKIVLMFALPMTAGAIALSDSYLIILSPEPPFKYREAAPILIVLSIDALLVTLSGLYGTVLLGFEKVDEKAKISFKELLRSRLFIAFSLPYLHSAITIPTTFYALTVCIQNDPVQASIYVSIINFAARFAMFLIQYVIIRRMVKVKVPWSNIAKYVFASALMAIVLFLLPHPTTIMLTFAITAVGGILYLLFVMALDKDARILVSRMLQIIKSKG